ncbi:MAG: 50S ribosomal protein L25 [Chloroflexota bacterium]
MENQELIAVRRSVVGKQVKALRREGKIPGVIYGKYLDPILIELDSSNLRQVLPDVTASSLVVIDLEGEKHTSLVRERQVDVLTRELLHIDFQALSMEEKVRTEVMIELVGESPVTQLPNAMLITGLEEVEVECLPKDLPEQIFVDISTLGKIGDVIHVKDLQVGEGVEILTDPEEVVVLATYVAMEEIEEVEEEELDVEPEVIERGKPKEKAFKEEDEFED